MMGDRSEETASSLAARLARIDNQLEPDEHKKVEQAAGKPLKTIVRDLFDAIDPDQVEADVIAAGIPQPDEAALEAACEKRVEQAGKVFTGKLITLLDTIRREKEQTIDHETLDTVTRAEWSGDAIENARQIATDFETYLSESRDEIEALTIFYSQPVRRAAVTHAMIKDVLAKLQEDRPRLAPLTVWRAYAHLDDYKSEQPINELTALVALIRRACGLDDSLTRHSERVRRNFKGGSWIATPARARSSRKSR